MRRGGRRVLLVCACAPALATAASAHTRSRSFSSVTLAAEGAELEARLRLLDLSRLPPDLLPSGSDPHAGYVAARLRLSGGGAFRAPRVFQPSVERREAL